MGYSWTSTSGKFLERHLIPDGWFDSSRSFIPLRFRVEGDEQPQCQRADCGNGQ